LFPCPLDSALDSFYDDIPLHFCESCNHIRGKSPTPVVRRTVASLNAARPPTNPGWILDNRRPLSPFHLLSRVETGLRLSNGPSTHFSGPPGSSTVWLTQ